MKKIMKLILMLVLIAGISAGCQGVAKPENAQDLVAKSQEEMKKKKSYTADYTMDMTMSIAGQSLTTKAAGNLKQITENMLTEMDMTMDLGAGSEEAGAQQMKMKMFTEVNPENKEELITYSNFADKWVKDIVSIKDSQGANMEESMAKMLEENKDSFTLQEETAEVAGKEVYTITGTLPAEAINSMTANTPVDGQNMKFNEDMKVDAIYYYDKETLLPVQAVVNVPNMKMEIDLGVEGVDPQNLDMTMNMLMNYTGFDNVESITIPEEAKNAEVRQK